MSNKAHQYALRGTGTKYVRLVPAPLDICLDARVMGNEGRFVRCGCWPNAVVQPFIPVEGAIKDDDDDEAEARFGVFALRDLELGEEIVLGWEWSVKHVVHKLVQGPQLEPLPEDEGVLNNPDTKRLGTSQISYDPYP
ncbi:SET domain and PHD finger protein [Ceratobasidium sp. AG-Ba]|nr:SET domain and PHD finger protein [Ceratobasidium sp. AG-Ba]